MLQRWLDACAASFPGAARRRRLGTLRRLLGERQAWEPAAYHAMLAGWGHHNRTLGVDDGASWRVCRLRPSSPSVGGYPCALWLLFHSLLANARPSDAYETLWTIRDWVEEFFGCRECARHFAETWASQGITKERGNLQNEAHSQMHAALWLWQAHNAVRARLYAEAWSDNAAIGSGAGAGGFEKTASIPDGSEGKWQFPNVWGECEACYTNEARAEWKAFRDEVLPAADGGDHSDDHEAMVEYEHFLPMETPFGYTFEVRRQHLPPLSCMLSTFRLSFVVSFLEWSKGMAYCTMSLRRLAPHGRTPSRASRP